MEKLTGTCVIGQSGGPTAVINASALGAIEAAMKNPCITGVLGARYGITGVLHNRLFDCAQEDPGQLALMKTTPASLLGSCRYKLPEAAQDDTDYRRIAQVFARHNVRYFFYNGGNDSMDTCRKVSDYLQKTGYDCRVIGIPKTIDNDLSGTDHCPGYGSAAKYIATSLCELHREACVYEKGTVLIVEIMGRNAGWLTAAAALAGVNGQGPDLVYLPEVAFDTERFLLDVRQILQRKKKAVVAVAEGIKDREGRYVARNGSQSTKQDAFGHTQMGGLAVGLAELVQKSTGAKTRGIEFSLLQRCAAHCASGTDIEEAYLAGQAAVEYAAAGASGKMVGFSRPKTGEYRCDTILSELSCAANAEKKVPASWINPRGNGLLQPFFDYALPLIAGCPAYPEKNGLPLYPHLKRIYV